MAGARVASTMAQRHQRDLTTHRVRIHGAELVGELAQYEDIYRLCCIRGPEGIIVGLAEELN